MEQIQELIGTVPRGGDPVEVGAKHFDEGKPDLTLFAVIPTESLIEIARVIEWGATKYGWDNWKAGMHWRRITASILRHLWAFLCGEDRDQSGMLHLAHAGADIMFAIYYQIHKIGTDDRIKTGTQ